MSQYRRSIPFDPTKAYHYVDMGRLNYHNGPGRYPFPSEDAAIRFATEHKKIAHEHYGVDREVSVLYPDGRSVSIGLTLNEGESDVL
ncbi:hypothetical protein [Mycobacterium paragordonae]|uniref:Uncharacterized protein n=1 Tax=Mycobacterium paragordonae TaxID=1389713 RepID=A0AAJ1W0G0_9MYCO|nr:hypothetical protein [Mycobacterium paragordonae]MDP7733666.1 hypothetical protein [Mycobacterium paragordonae]